MNRRSPNVGGPPADPMGAFCRDNHAAIDGAPAGPLRGLTFAAKDVFHVAGHRTGFGNPVWLRSHRAAARTAQSVQSLVDAGATMAARTITDELTYSLTGENVHYGTPVNPRAPDRVPGGSSSGSASAVAGGLVDFALGTDCGGSVRIPASYCGIYGFRPSHGRVSARGVLPFAPSFDVVGWFAREAHIMEKVGSVLLGGDERRHRFGRALIAADCFELANPTVANALRPGLRRVAGSLAEQTSATIGERGLDVWFEVFRTIQAWEIWSNHKAWIEKERPKFGRGIRERLDWAAGVSKNDLAAARRERRHIRKRLDALLGDRNILILPTSPGVAPRKLDTADEVEIRVRQRAMCLLCIAGLGGLPQVTLPLAETRGLPVGLSIVGPRGSDRALLSLASKLTS